MALFDLRLICNKWFWSFRWSKRVWVKPFIVNKFMIILALIISGATILYTEDKIKRQKKSSNETDLNINSMRHNRAERISLTFFHITVPSVHLTYIHKHSIFIGVAICCTNRKIIVWTLTLTVDVLWHTNCLIGLCYCCCCCWWCYAGYCCRRCFDAQNDCNHFRKGKKKIKSHMKRKIKFKQWQMTLWINPTNHPECWTHHWYSHDLYAYMETLSFYPKLLRLWKLIQHCCKQYELRWHFTEYLYTTKSLIFFFVILFVISRNKKANSRHTHKSPIAIHHF